MDFTVHAVAKSWTRLSDFHFTYIQSGTQCWDTLRDQPKYLLLLCVFNYFYFKIYVFSLEDNCFTILWWFLPYINMNQPEVYMSPPPHPESPSCLPPHAVPLCCPRAAALGTLLHVLNLHWSSVWHMVKYMFQCYSLKSFHPLLPLIPKVCFLCLCLLCCLACRIVSPIFLNSTYMS